MNTPFRANSSIDPANGRIQFTLVDAYGNGLVDERVDAKVGGRWQFDGKNESWTYSSGDKKSGVQKIVISKAKSKFEAFNVEVQGLFDSNRVLDLRALRPAAALIVGWTGDITGPCATVTTPECIIRDTPGFGTNIFCRGNRSLEP